MALASAAAKYQAWINSVPCVGSCLECGRDWGYFLSCEGNCNWQGQPMSIRFVKDEQPKTVATPTPAAPAGFGAPPAPAGFGAPPAAPRSEPPPTPRVAGPALPLAGFGPPPIAKPASPPAPEGFSAVKHVAAYDLAARYRKQAAACDFDQSDRATRLLAAAKELEQGSALFVPEREIE